jgi:Rod binding domain-containing protein
MAEIDTLLNRLPGAARADKDVARIYRAAEEFEALLIGSLLRSLQETFAGSADSPGSDEYQYMGTSGLAAMLARQGGLGLARPIVRQLRGTKGAGGEFGSGVDLKRADPGSALR